MHRQPADRLTGILDRWSRSGEKDEAGNPTRLRAKLFGVAVVTNTGDRACRLRGETDTRLRDAGRELPIGYSHAINEEGRTRVTVVPPGGRAELRLDWTGPFCVATTGPLELDIRLPDGGGSLRAPVRDPARPPCGGPSETHPEIRSYLSTGAFDEPSEPTADDSPLQALVASPGPAPAARSGQLVTWVVTLRNLTAAAVPLDPCPGYYQELFSMGDATTQAVNEGTVYRLNCRPVRSVPARGAVRFAMGVAVPAGMAGRVLDVEWRLLAPRLGFPPGLRAHLRIPVSS